jgi:hypothetical protein
MTDEVLKELWDTKDSIAKEHGYSIDSLAEYYLKKQTSRHRNFHQEKESKRSNKAINTDA